MARRDHDYPVVFYGPDVRGDAFVDRMRKGHGLVIFFGVGVAQGASEAFRVNFWQLTSPTGIGLPLRQGDGSA